MPLMARFGFLSTYPPTRCGLATFTAALAAAMVRDGRDDAVVVRVDDLVPAGPAVATPGVTVVGKLLPGDGASRVAAAAQLNECDVAIVQHEYGIYGGPDGDEVLDVLERLTIPSIVVLHTVPADPSPEQRVVLRQVAGLADAVVVMTRTTQALLVEGYGVSASRVHLIPHGVDPWIASPIATPSRRPVVLTWGLIGPGKGIEWGIRGMACLGSVQPRPIYRVLGQTHPKVLLRQGEQYRRSLLSLVKELRLAADVQIDGRYQEAAELAGQIGQADLILLPYDSVDQATSGVLAEAVGAGKVVIATRFPHAVELLSDDRGLLVGHRRPLEIAQAIIAALGDTHRAEVALARAESSAEANSWPQIAGLYRALMASMAPA